MARTKYVNGGTVAGKDGEMLTRCYVCGQPYRELNQLDTKRTARSGPSSSRSATGARPSSRRMRSVTDTNENGTFSGPVELFFVLDLE